MTSLRDIVFREIDTATLENRYRAAITRIRR